MTQDEFESMLKESGLELYGLGKDRFKFIAVCTDFANMVARKEASKVASQIISAAVVAEREALEFELLKLRQGVAANGDYIQGRWDLIGEFQDIIRARGKA
jgi:hypothetical protein